MQALSEQYDNPTFPQNYLSGYGSTAWNRFKGDDDARCFVIRELYDAFQHIPSNQGTILDFGAGPSIINAYLAAPKFRKIVLAEYAAENREELRKWHTNDSQRVDWVELLSGLLMSSGGIPFDGVQYESLYQSVQNIVSCNLLDDPVLPANEQLGHGTLDGVVTTLALEAGAPNWDMYKNAMKKLVGYLKPGGYFIQAGVFGQDYYTVGGERLHSFSLPAEQFTLAAEDAGISLVKESVFTFTKPVPKDVDLFSNADGFLVISGKKE